MKPYFDIFKSNIVSEQFTANELSAAKYNVTQRGQRVHKTTPKAASSAALTQLLPSGYRKPMATDVVEDNVDTECSFAQTIAQLLDARNMVAHEELDLRGFVVELKDGPPLFLNDEDMTMDIVLMFPHPVLHHCISPHYIENLSDDITLHVSPDEKQDTLAARIEAWLPKCRRVYQQWQDAIEEQSAQKPRAEGVKMEAKTFGPKARLPFNSTIWRTAVGFEACQLGHERAAPQRGGNPFEDWMFDRLKPELAKKRRRRNAKLMQQILGLLKEDGAPWPTR